MATKKYLGLDALAVFLDNLRNLFATKTEMDTKSDKSHTHTISDITNLQSTLNGKAPSSHGTHVSYSTTNPVMDGTASIGSASTVSRSDHRHPTDTSRAAQTSLDSHTSNTTSHITSSERTNWGTGYTHSQAAHAPSNAEKNQNAFSYVKVGDTSVSADTTTDTLTLVAGSNITITPDATNDKITISSKDTTYTLSSFGITSTAAELNKLDGVTATATEINYVDGVTSNIQTQLDNKVPTSRTINGKALSSNITLSASDIGAAASSHTHSYLPLSGGNLTGTLGVGNKYELSPAYNYTNGCLIDIGSAKSSTMVAIHITGNSYNSSTLPIDSLFQFYDYGDGTIMNYSGVNLGLSLGAMTVYRYNNRLYAHIKQTASYQTLSFTLLTNKSGLSPTVSNSAAHTSGYTDLITITPVNNITSSNIGSQSVNYATSAGSASSATKATQDASGNVITSTYATKTALDTGLAGKAASSHTHNYAGSTSAGGSATSAKKLDTTDAGSATQPVYFSGGVPKATTYTLGKSVPSDAKFTDTHYSSKNVVGATNATSNTATALTNGNVYLNSVENGAVTSSHKISGSGATTVTTDANGNIVISSTDNNTTYSAAGSALGLVKSGGDVTISSGVITVNDDSHNHTIANIDNLQSSLDAKQATVTGGASTITSSNLTANRALISDSSGKVAVSAVTNTELGYLDGVTSNVQTQLDGKVKTSYKSYSSFGTASTGTDGWYTLFTINDSTNGSAICLLKGYAHSSVIFTVTKGYSTSASLNILDCNTSLNNGYAHIKALRILSDGKVQAQINTGTVNISIHIISANGWISPVDSLICDTSSPTVCVTRTLTHGKIIADGFVGNLSGNATTATNVGWSGVTSKPSYYDAKAIKSITRNGTTFTYTCMDGTTGTFTQQDNNTTYSAVTTSANGLMIASDKVKLDGMVLATVSEVETYLGI